MCCTFRYRLKNIAAASLSSCFIAGAITTLTSSVSADNAAGVTISVNRTSKGDRRPIVPIDQPVQHNSTEQPASEHTLLGCEPAFSPVADPTRAHIFTHCMA
jgi:hypothetical protein